MIVTTTKAQSSLAINRSQRRASTSGKRRQAFSAAAAPSPGLVTLGGDRIARVAVRLLGTVVELRKRLGDPVEQDEVVAVIESREVADAKSEYLATRVTDELQQTLFARATSLWQSKVVTENDYLRARASAQDARVKFDTARQKLFTLGLSEEQIAALPNQPVASLRRQELRSPITGRIAERRVDLWCAGGPGGPGKRTYTSWSTCPNCGSTLQFRQPTCLPSGRGRNVGYHRRRRQAGSGSHHFRQSAARSRDPLGPRRSISRKS